MGVKQSTLTIPMADLSPEIQAALTLGRSIDVTDGATRVAVLVPIESAALSTSEALAAIEALLERADSMGQGDSVRKALAHAGDQPGRA